MRVCNKKKKNILEAIYIKGIDITYSAIIIKKKKNRSFLKKKAVRCA